MVVYKGLKRHAIGYASNVVIAVASVAPGYSLAATLGLLVAIQGVGLAAPAVVLVAFLPMLLIAGAYRHEPGAPRLRDDVLMGHARDGAAARLARRAGRSSSRT